MKKEVLSSILNLANHAPSGDNMQPWRFEIQENDIHVYMIPEKTHPYLDFKNRILILNMGILIKSIELAASRYNVGITEKIFPEGYSSNLVATLSLTDNLEVQSDILSDYILSRCTNRKPYINKVIPEGILNELQGIKNDNVNLRFISDTAHRNIIAKAATCFIRVMLENEKMHKYFFSQIVWTQSDEKKKKSGLYLATMEFNAVQKFMFRKARKWKVIRQLNKIGFSKMVASEETKSCSSGGSIVLFTVKDQSPEKYFQAGKVASSLWLSATKHNLAVQPVTGTLYMIQKIEAGEEGYLKNHHMELLRNEYKNLIDAVKLHEGEVPVFLLRIGYAEPPSARTSRKEVEIKW